MSRLAIAFVTALALSSGITPACAAVNMSAELPATTVSDAVLNAGGLTLHVFTFPTAPTTLPSSVGTTPDHTTTTALIALGALPLSTGTRNTNVMARVRGRIRAEASGTHTLTLSVNEGGSVSIDGAVIARGSNVQSVVGKVYMRAGEDYEIEALGYNGDAASTFAMSLSWSKPGAGNTKTVVPSTAYYAPLDSSCKKTCGDKACRVDESQIVAECFTDDAVGVSQDALAENLEDIFPI
jgi:hypothetical protein